LVRDWALKNWACGLAVLAFFAWPATQAAPAAQAAGGVYVADNGSGSVSQFGVSGGGLSALSPSSVSAGQSPFGVVVSPDGKSVYVANAADVTVSEYDVAAATGALSAKSTATVPAGADPNGIAIAPNGKSAYVANYGNNTVSQYGVNPATGVLSPMSTATVATGNRPLAIGSPLTASACT
jgi:sugar lactone lactonase YvrE